MRSIRSSISCCRCAIASGRKPPAVVDSDSAAANGSEVTASSMEPPLVPDAGERVLEAEERAEAGLAGEATPVDRARILEEVNRARRRGVEAQSEELTDGGAHQRLGE